MANRHEEPSRIRRPFLSHKSDGLMTAALKTKRSDVDASLDAEFKSKQPRQKFVKLHPMVDWDL
jgi:hypothetical protein